MDPGEAVVFIVRVILNIGERQCISVILNVHPPRVHQLAAVVHATYALRLGLGFGQCGQKQPGQNSDNGDDHQQFNQGKAAKPSVTAASQ